MDNYREKALEFLKSHTVAVLSTLAADGNPDAAVIYTLVDDDFNFLFITKSETTKAKNLEQHKNVALTFFDQVNLGTVQVKGLISNMETDKDYAPLFLKTAEVSAASGVPPISQLTNSGEYVLYKLVPTWLRFGDFSKKSVPSEAKQNVFHQIIPNA